MKFNGATVKTEAGLAEIPVTPVTGECGSPGRTESLDNRLTEHYNRLMKTDNRFMSELIRIINGALRLDIDKVRNYTAFLADKLEKSGDKASALRLRKMLE